MPLGEATNQPPSPKKLGNKENSALRQLNNRLAQECVSYKADIEQAQTNFECSKVREAELQHQLKEANTRLQDLEARCAQQLIQVENGDEQRLAKENGVEKEIAAMSLMLNMANECEGLLKEEVKTLKASLEKEQIRHHYLECAMQNEMDAIMAVSEVSTSCAKNLEWQLEDMQLALEEEVAARRTAVEVTRKVEAELQALRAEKVMCKEEPPEVDCYDGFWSYFFR
eukprot:gene12895-15241_t